MNLPNKNIRIFLAGLFSALLSIVIIVWGFKAGYLFVIGIAICAIILGFIVWFLLKYQSGDMDFKEDHNNNKIEGRYEIKDQLKEHYKNLLHSVFNTIQSINPEYNCAVYIFDHDNSGFMLQGSTSTEFLEFISPEQKMITLILRQSNTKVFQYKNNKDEWSQLFHKKTWRGSECVLGIRIVNKGVSVGCLFMTIDHFSKTQNRDTNILHNVGELLSLGISKIEKIEELITDNNYQDRILDLFETVDIFSDEEVLYDSIQALCKSLFTYDKMTIAMMNSSNNLAIIKQVDGVKEDVDSGDTISLEHSLHGKVIKDNKIIRTRNWKNDYPELGRYRQNEDYNINISAVLSIPILMADKPIGVIALERLTSRSFTYSDERLMKHLSSTVGHFLLWQKEYHRMHESAIHDGLTGLLNHRAFMRRFEDEISRAIRFHQNLVLVVLDLDKFKRINDTHGHLYGDYVIKTVGEIIQNSVRNIDVVARYGGEEFTVILVDTNQSSSLVVAERIVQNVENYNFSLNGINEHMSISAGMSEFPGNSNELKSLIDFADKAMYRAKNLGGNKVEVSSDNL